MISLKRWTKQALTDDFKQECILILQGLDPSSQHSVVEKYVNNQIDKQANLSNIKKVKNLVI